jgi:hypothetical protein
MYSLPLGKAGFLCGAAFVIDHLFDTVLEMGSIDDR